MSAFLVSGAIFDVTYFGGILVSGVVTARRGQAAIRRRVEARGGRPIDDVEAWARLAWGGIKSVLWPLNLAAWLAVGRPAPGSFRSTRTPAPRSAEGAGRNPASVPAPAAPAPAVPASRHARPEPVTSAPPLARPPSSGRHAGPGPAPSSASLDKGAAAGAAYVGSPTAPTPPPALPSPVVDGPRAEFGAPQIEPGFVLDVLSRAGFPATPHNVFAVQERLGIMFTVKARQFIQGMGTERDWQTFVRRAGYPDRDMHAWPQRVLSALARWDSDAVPHIQDFPARYSAMLLEEVGEGRGFFGGPADVPLPTATDWHRKGIGQPTARLLAAPR